VVLAAVAAAAGIVVAVVVAAPARAGSAGAVVAPSRGGAIAGQPRAATAACANGPCASPTPVAFLTGGEAAVVVANFGLLVPAPASAEWQVVCDDVYGTPMPGLVRRDGRGRLFVAGADGVMFSDDGCVWARAAGVVAGREVHDLAFEAGSAGRVWALAGEPPALAMSRDGSTFETVHTFGDERTYRRLMVAPSDPQRFYAVAPGPGGPASTILATSVDGGDSWTARDLVEGLAAPPETPLALVAIAPADPQVLFFTVVDAFGDEIWRSEDGGRSLQRVLKGGPRDWMTGVAFGADGQTVYASASVVPLLAGDPPGRLYISRDGGRTFGLAVSAAPTGPSYRCLHAAGGTLYACGLGEPGGEAFLLGASTDEGKTWQSLLRLELRARRLRRHRSLAVRPLPPLRRLGALPRPGARCRGRRQRAGGRRRCSTRCAPRAR
jgi:hypothetical protein